MNKDFLKAYIPNPVLLGSGGFGFVTTAVRKLDAIEVAVKFILKEKVPANAWARDPVLGIVPTEVYILKNVSHPNVIKYLDYFEDNMYLYLVTELHGGSWGPYTTSGVSGVSTATSLSSAQSATTLATTRKNGTGMSPTVSMASSTSTLDSCDTLFPMDSGSRRGSVVESNNCGNSSSSSSSSSNGGNFNGTGTTVSGCSVTVGGGSGVGFTPLERRNSCDLFECIEYYQRFTEEQARHVFKQIVSAVSYLESNRIIHRDIKDENILIDREFNVKLIDFGSATVLDRNGRVVDGLFLGTLQYAAPEILSGRPSHGSECEVWSLGCCLYIMLAGEAPFESPKDVIQLDRPLAPRNVVLSHGVSSLIMWMLEKDPKKRATVRDVLRHPWVVNG
ncbi:UNVERIFIED_CONTAM: hypothetical protein HDU68_007328, partial [Siphonaria sp. JEL0065]